MITVSQLTPASDLAPVRAFVAEQLHELFPTLRQQGERPDMRQLAEVYISAPRAFFLVAATRQEIVGTVALRPYDDRLADVRGIYAPQRTAEVCRCYVAAKQRGRGIGTALMKALYTHAAVAGYDTLCLHTHRHLPGGFDFWQRQGFSVRHEQPPSATDMGVVYMDKLLWP